MSGVLASTYFGHILSTFFISMAPIVELRGGIPWGVAQGLPLWLAFTVSLLGNMVPVPFIMLFLRKVFDWLRRWEKSRDLVEKLERRAHLKGAKVEKYKALGLFVLVAIPLPGTGAWTGALVASVLDIRMKIAIPTIMLGVLAAGLIVLAITGGAVSLM